MAWFWGRRNRERKPVIQREEHGGIFFHENKNKKCYGSCCKVYYFLDLIADSHTASTSRKCLKLGDKVFVFKLDCGIKEYFYQSFVLKEFIYISTVYNA